MSHFSVCSSHVFGIMEFSFPLLLAGKSMSTRRFKAFTLVELLTVIAIIGVLIATLLPAVQSAREAARRAQCQNHLRQTALGVELFHDAMQCYPPARLTARPKDEMRCGATAATWMVRILPFIEEQNVFSQWDVYDAWYRHAESARNPSVPVFACPSRRSVEDAHTSRKVSESSTQVLTAGCGCPISIVDQDSFEVTGTAADYAGNHGDLSPGAIGDETDFYYGGNGTGVIISSRPKCTVSQNPDVTSWPPMGSDDPGDAIGWISRISHRNVTDGLSKTFLVGEKHVPLARLRQFPEDSPAFDGDHFPAASRVAGIGAPIARGDIDDDPSSIITFGSSHAGICNFAMADGSVRAISNNTSTRALSLLSHRSNP